MNTQAVYEAFSQPGNILTQLSRMPDGRTYLWIARTVAHRSGGYGSLCISNVPVS